MFRRSIHISYDLVCCAQTPLIWWEPTAETHTHTTRWGEERNRKADTEAHQKNIAIPIVRRTSFANCSPGRNGVEEIWCGCFCCIHHHQHHGFLLFNCARHFVGMYAWLAKRPRQRCGKKEQTEKKICGGGGKTVRWPKRASAVHRAPGNYLPPDPTHFSQQYAIGADADASGKVWTSSFIPNRCRSCRGLMKSKRFHHVRFGIEIRSKRHRKLLIYEYI